MFEASWVPRGSGGPIKTLVRFLPAVAAVYVLSWLMGLTLGPPTAAGPWAPPGDLDASYVGHGSEILIQSLLVHGLAGIALAGIALGCARALCAVGSPVRWTRTAGLAAGLAAGPASLVQAVLAVIAWWVADIVPPTRSGALLATVNGAGIVKLLSIAAFVSTVTYAGRQVAGFPGWLRLLGHVLVTLLIVGCLAFLVHSLVLSLLLAASPALLLLWAPSVSWVIGGRRGRWQPRDVPAEPSARQRP